MSRTIGTKPVFAVARALLYPRSSLGEEESLESQV